MVPVLILYGTSPYILHFILHPIIAFGIAKGNKYNTVYHLTQSYKIFVVKNMFFNLG